MIFTYQHQGQSHTVRLEAGGDGRYTAWIGERRLDVQAARLLDGSWRLVIDEQAQRVYTAARKDERHVFVAGSGHVLTAGEPRRKRSGSAGGGDLTAQMPGQVTRVLVSDGETVHHGQTLVILEAMKMEIRVTAPDEGRIRRVLVQAGEVVERGQALVEFDAGPSSG
ncbi:MAG: biotin/lipoyl-binding protein [Anaerolineae bacterium]|nr:biotin/lipoyl-binding protein [Anaerolineae bacterium]